MDDALIERAVAPLRTLASEWRERAVTDGRLQGGDPWWRGHAVSKKDDATELEQAIERLTAALAEVEADIRAGALRDLADHMEKDGLRFIHISVVTDYADTIEKEGKA